MPMAVLIGWFLSTRALKGTSGRKNIKLEWKSVKNAKKGAITDLNAPNGSRDIPFQSQELGKMDIAIL